MNNEFLQKIVTRRNLHNCDVNAEPKYYLTHNKECVTFRRGVMENADQLTRGFMFGTACICHGAEDRILNRIEYTVTRYYKKDNFRVETVQRGFSTDADSPFKVNKNLKDAEKLKKIKDSVFSDEVITEVTGGY